MPRPRRPRSRLPTAALALGLSGLPAACGPAVRTTANPTSPTTALATGVYGYVTAGPTCPLEQAADPCPPRAVAGRVEARRGTGSAVSSTAIDPSGRYALDLAPGAYVLVVVTAGAFPRCPDTRVDVGAGAPARVDVACDTGIR